eukprot:3941361-Rhodomonas_salina.6
MARRSASESVWSKPCQLRVSQLRCVHAGALSQMYPWLGWPVRASDLNKGGRVAYFSVLRSDPTCSFHFHNSST